MQDWTATTKHGVSRKRSTKSAAAQVAPDLLKALAILSDTTVKRSAVDQEDLEL